MKSSQQLWETIDHLRIFPTGEASHVRSRWFRPDRAGADDPAQFGRWLVTNGYLTRYALEQILAGKGEQLRVGTYLLLDPIHSGAHTGAFLASDTLGRKVLIDLVDPTLASSSELVRAFEAAAERVMAVQHINVNRVLDFGQAQGRLYLAREHDDGVTLAEVLARRRSLEPDHAARLFALAFAGLQALHDKQVQGGDLVPESLLLATTGKKGRIVKILRPGMPSTLFAGDRPTPSAADIIPWLRPLSRPEDDLFRLGQTFYLSLTGRQSEATLAGKAARPIQDLVPAVPELLAETVEQLLTPDLSARPRVPSRVAKTLRVYLASAEEARELRAEEEIASPNEPIQPAPAPIVEDEEEPAPEKFGKEPVATTKLGELWMEIRPRQRDWVFLAGGAASVILVVLLVTLLTGITLVNVVCLLTGAALSFLAERMIVLRESEAE